MPVPRLPMECDVLKVKQEMTGSGLKPTLGIQAFILNLYNTDRLQLSTDTESRLTRMRKYCLRLCSARAWEHALF